MLKIKTIICFENLVNYGNMKTGVYTLHTFGLGPFTRTLVFPKFVYNNFIYFRHRHVEIYPACLDKVLLIFEETHALNK